MSLMKRFPPVAFEANTHELQCIVPSFYSSVLTIYEGDTNYLQKDQKQQDPGGNKLINESHPVYSCL